MEHTSLLNRCLNQAIVGGCAAEDCRTIKCPGLADIQYSVSISIAAHYAHRATLIIGQREVLNRIVEDSDEPADAGQRLQPGADRADLNASDVSDE